jgi:preprotein translocase subunit SecG
MYTFLLVLLVLDAAVLIAVILLQSGKGGGLAASFGGASSAAEAVIGSRQAGNILTKTSWWAGGIFLGLSFVLQIAGGRARTPASVLDRSFTPAPAARRRRRPAVPVRRPPCRSRRRRRRPPPRRRRPRRSADPQPTPGASPRSPTPSRALTVPEHPGFLLLEDGTLFRGRLIGAPRRRWRRSCSPRT